MPDNPLQHILDERQPDGTMPDLAWYRMEVWRLYSEMARCVCLLPEKKSIVEEAEERFVLTHYKRKGRR